MSQRRPLASREGGARGTRRQCCEDWIGLAVDLLESQHGTAQTFRDDQGLELLFSRHAMPNAWMLEATLEPHLHVPSWHQSRHDSAPIGED